MSHHGVRCDYVVFLSAFAGTGIADNSDPLLGASLTASLALPLEPLGGTGHRGGYCQLCLEVPGLRGYHHVSL